MKFNEYQDWTKTTAIYPNLGIDGIVYCTLKLNGEAGEVAEKLGKCMRDDGGKISDTKRLDLALELGDVLWYLARLADELGFNFDEIATINQRKLESRKERGKLQGSGDGR